MEFKVVVSDPKSRRSYQAEVKDERAKKFVNLKIGTEFDGSVIGLTGYKLLITGGSDKSGFPMRKGVHGASRPKLLLEGGVGYKPRRRVRKRKRVRGEVISEDLVQINTKVIGYGKKGIEELLGLEKPTGEGTKEEAKAPEEKPAEKPKEKEAEEKPAEKKEDKPEEKPKERKAEKPKEDKSPEKPKEAKPVEEPKKSKK